MQDDHVFLVRVWIRSKQYSDKFMWSSQDIRHWFHKMLIYKVIEVEHMCI